MNNETIKLFAKYCFGEASARDFSDWAINCLENGFDSKNIRILASMFNAQYLSEIEPYFIRVLDDLNRDYPKEEIHLLEYAKLIAKQILNKEISAVEGCNEIYKVYRNLDYEPELADWDYLHSGMHPETYEDLVFGKKGIEQLHLLDAAISEEAAKMIYGKKTTVRQYKTNPDFELTEIKEENLFLKLWKRIF